MYRSTTKRTRLCKDAAGYRPAGGHRFRALRFERLEVRHLLAAVSWTGLGDGQLWSDPNNWSAEAVPVAGDDVSINLPGNPTIVYSAAAGNTTVNSLNGSDSLSITGGSLTVTANSTVSGSFSMTGGTLTATGSGVSFLASGPTTINGASLYATASATLSFPSATSYAADPAVSWASTTWQASGANSVLDLPSVTSVTGSTGYDAGLNIQALAGGEVDLPELTGNAGGEVSLESDGSGSLLNVPLVTSFDSYSYVFNPVLQVTNYGNINDGDQSLAVSNVGVVIDPTGTLSVGVLQLGSGSTLSGSGTIPGSLINSGTIYVGGNGTAGTLSVSGNFTQTSGGALDIDVGGTAAGTQFDQLLVQGAVSLDGSINSSLINSFVPSPGTDLQIIQGASISGIFSTVTGATLPDGTSLRPEYLPTEVSLIPMLSVLPPANQTMLAGVSQVFSLGSFADPNPGPWTVDVNWGDGTQDAVFATDSLGTLPAQSHTYALAGSETVTVTVTNPASGQFGTAYFQVVDVSLLLALSGPTSLVAGGPASGADAGIGTYTLSVTNAGPSNASDVTVTDAIPPVSGATETFNVLSGGGSVSTVGTVTTWNEGVLASGASALLQIVVTADPTTAAGSIISQSATLTDLEAGETNPGVIATTSLDTTVTRVVGLDVTESASPAGNLIAGLAGSDTVTYVVTVTNLPYSAANRNGGFSDATGVTATDTLNLDASVATLPAGATATFTYTVLVSDAGLTGSVVDNVVTVGTATALGSSSTTTYSTTTTVDTQAGLSLVQQGPASVVAGTTITYSLSVTNTGPSDAADVSLTDSLPAANATLVFQSPGAGFTAGTVPVVGAAGGSIIWTGLSLAAGASAHFIVVVATNGSAPCIVARIWTWAATLPSR